MRLLVTELRDDLSRDEYDKDGGVMFSEDEDEPDKRMSSLFRNKITWP